MMTQVNMYSLWMMSIQNRRIQLTTRTKKRKKRKRRERNKQIKADLLTHIEGGGVCARRAFQEQVRKGDVVSVGFEFSGVRVPYDLTSDTPGKDIQERTELIMELATEGEA